RDLIVTGVQTCALPIFEPGLVIPMSHGNACDKPLDAGHLGAVELRVFQVNVVHDLCNRHEAPVVEAEARHEDLEGAEVAVVGERSEEHTSELQSRSDLV